jgi:hypothetical protein
VEHTQSSNSPERNNTAAGLATAEVGRQRSQQNAASARTPERKERARRRRRRRRWMGLDLEGERERELGREKMDGYQTGPGVDLVLGGP